jgi:hypothetical protein
LFVHACRYLWNTVRQSSFMLTTVHPLAMA